MALLQSSTVATGNTSTSNPIDTRGCRSMGVTVKTDQPVTMQLWVSDDCGTTYAHSPLAFSQVGPDVVGSGLLVQATPDLSVVIDVSPFVTCQIRLVNASGSLATFTVSYYLVPFSVMQ